MTQNLVTGGEHVRVETVATDARTLGDVIRLRAAKTPDRAAQFAKRDGHWQRTSWRELYDQARRVARGLVDLGLEVGDCVSVLGPTGPEWARQELGAQLCGVVTNGIYPNQSAEQIRFLLEHSATRVVFVAEEHELANVLEAVRGNAHLKAIVPWSAELAERFSGVEERVVSPERFEGEALGEDEIDARLATLDPDDTAILVYTSGTTGAPKGAMISHANVLATLSNQANVFTFFDDDLLFSFLPMAHVTERNLVFHLRVGNGVAAAYASSIGAVLAEIGEVRPTVFGAVPRIFEKAYDRICSESAKKSGLVRKVFAWATGVGRQTVPYALTGKRWPAFLELERRLAHRLVFRKIHAVFGGRVRAFITGAAPISAGIVEFFWAVGLPTYEAYGMTEATVVTHVNREGSTRIGSVGRVIPPMECRIAEDGEIEMRGPFVFKGYFKNEAATRETIVDGWLRTGDVGKIDEDGFLTITDRKKHIIVTAGGKNVAPANIERAIKSQSPLISQVHAHGDRRPYVSAILTPSPLETLEWGAAHGVVSAGELEARRRELLADPAARSAELNEAMARVVAEERFRKLFVEPVMQGNAQLARVEKVRRFHLLERDFSQEEGELTPTMKARRKFIEDKYAELFDRIYEDDGFAVSLPS